MSTIRLATRVSRIKPSPTLTVANRAKELKAEGKDIIGLGAGEPDFDTPRHAKDAAIQAINDGFTKYTAVEGTPSLKRAIIAKFKRDNGLNYTPGQVLVSVGGKHSFFNLAQALLQSGDEVIIPAPYWVSYPDMVLLADAQPVIISAGIDQGFKIRPEQLRGAITDRTRLLVINSPSNPTGVAYTRAELTELGAILRDYAQVLIATDDIYEHIQWSGEPFSNIINACPDLAHRTIVINGVSKAYAMTGWRIGYAAGPEPLIRAMANIQSQSTSNPASIAQVAAEAALTGDQSRLAPMVQAFKERHDYVIKRLNDIKGFRCLPGQGAFYAFPDVSAALAQAALKSDVEFAEYILNRAGVALVPGSAFGAEGYLRLSYATSMDILTAALDRLEQLFGKNTA